MTGSISGVRPTAIVMENSVAPIPLCKAVNEQYDWHHDQHEPD